MPRIRSIAFLAVVPAVLLGGPLAAAADESSKSPKQIVADVKRDLATVTSYHVSGVERDAKTTTRVNGDVSADGKADMTIREGDASARLIALPPTAYIKANTKFWKASGAGKDASKLAGRWFKITDESLTKFAQELAPKELAACVDTGNGTLAKGGTTTVAGKRTVVVVDKGDKPGTAPGKLYASTTAPIVPLRIVQTGKRSKGGGHVPKRCADTVDHTTRSSDVRFSKFNEAVSIQAPPGAIELPTGN